MDITGALLPTDQNALVSPGFDYGNTGIRTAVLVRVVQRNRINIWKKILLERDS